jgi:hypothetical protein
VFCPPRQSLLKLAAAQAERADQARQHGPGGSAG